MSRYVKLAALLAAIWAPIWSPRALAGPNQAGVLSGSTIIFSALNQFSAQYGDAYINGAWTQLSGAVFNTKGNNIGGTVFCNDTGNPIGQKASSVYYIYYAAYPVGVGTSYIHVISTLAPVLGDGSPSGVLQFNPPGLTQVNTQSAVFLGSYLTDANSDMIPFSRDGEEVLLDPILTNGAAMFPNTFTFANQAAAQRVAVAAPAQLPKTASAMIVDFQIPATPGAPNVFVLDPLLNALATMNPFSQLVLSPQALSAVRVEHVAVSVSHAGPNNVVLDAWNSPAFSITMNWVGYVEAVHHLSP